MDIFSLSFVYLFLPISLLIYYVTPFKLKNLCLLGISIMFYWLLEPMALGHMIISLLFDYMLLQIMKFFDDNQFIRMVITGISVTKTIGAIMYFSRNTGVIMFVGMSVYLLTAMGYIIDAYDYKAPYESSFVNFSLMCVFFGKIYVGPLVTYNNMMPQIRKRKSSLSYISSGIIQFISGLAKKILLADSISSVFVSLKEIPANDLSIVAVWSMIICFGFYIYFLLSSLSDMALGIGKMFGFDLPKNFYYPYQAKTVTEFFSRFNMSLSDFIKRYICFDLIGYKHYKAIGNIQLLIVGILFGLWFKLELKFALWGIYIIIFVLLEKNIYAKYLKKVPSIISRAISFIVVMMSFTILVSDNMQQFIFYIKAMFGLNLQSITSDLLLYIMDSNYVIIIICFVLSTSIADHTLRFIESKRPKLSDILNVLVNIGLLIVATAFML